MNCPVCESEAEITDIPTKDVYICSSCDSIFEKEGERIFMMDRARSHEDDKDAKAALSPTHVTSMKSFVDQAERMSWQMNFEWNANMAAMRETVAKVESRITGALSKLTELSLGLDGIDEIVAALEDARVLVSDNKGKYGVPLDTPKSAEG